MMGIWQVYMRMIQTFMPVPVTVRLTYRTLMRMLVVFVMRMPMFMLLR